MRYAPWLSLVACCLAIPFLLSGQAYYTGVFTYAVVLALFGLSVNLTVGYLGYVSFGHAAFFGLGAYSAALLTLKLGLNFWLALLLAPIPAALLGSLIGFASLRVGGSHFAIATLTVAEILFLLAGNLMELTRGPLGLIVPRPRIAWLDSLGIGFQQYYLAIALVVLLLATACLYRIMHSPIGRSWSVVKESPALAESVGIRTLRVRVMNVAISGALAGLAGALFVPRTLVVVPELFGSGLSATGLLIAILGGKATLVGPIMGGAAFAALPEALRFVDNYRMAVFAAMLLLVVRVQPDGLAAWLPRVWRVGRRKQCMPSGHALAFASAGALSARALTRKFGGLAAVDGVDIRVESGEVVGIIGPNGAGKTTCLSLISGFIRPTSGQVTFDGKDLVGLPPSRLADRGLIRTFQQTAVCGGMSCFHNVLAAVPHGEGLFSAILRGRGFAGREAARAQRAMACLNLVGLGGQADTVASAMPYGDQKLLSIAVALAANPRLLMLDEPAAGLNHTEARVLSELLLKLRATGLTILLVDHNLKMMMVLCDRIYVLNGGRPLVNGTPATVRNDPRVVAAYLGERKSEEAVHAAG